MSLLFPENQFFVFNFDPQAVTRLEWNKNIISLDAKDQNVDSKGQDATSIKSLTNKNENVIVYYSGHLRRVLPNDVRTNVPSKIVNNVNLDIIEDRYIIISMAPILNGSLGWVEFQASFASEDEVDEYEVTQDNLIVVDILVGRIRKVPEINRKQKYLIAKQKYEAKKLEASRA